MRPSPRPKAVSLEGVVLLSAWLLPWSLACAFGGSDPPPPPHGGGAGTAQISTAPPGQVMITVSASSMPQGATVTGGGRMLGRTPFTAQVPIPLATPGQTQTFQFTFQLPGYQPATVSASPINNTITLNATLAPVLAAPGAVDPSAGTTTAAAGATAQGPRIVAHGSPGGAIYDMHTTTSTARVDQQCVIADLDVEVEGTHSYFSDLAISLRGPDGTSYQLHGHTVRNPFREHSVRRAAGHSSQGQWTLSVADTVRADSGQLRGFTLTIQCR